MDYIFGGYDGSGVANDVDYAKEFEKSFVRQLAYEHPAWRKVSYYQRGPRSDGFDTYSKLERLKNSLRPHLQTVRQGKAKLVLAGYSRGAAGVVKLCKEYQEIGIGVHLLILFDAVSMQVSFDASTVPSNVSNCFHSIRNPITRSRHTWGNCAMRIEDRKKTFYPTVQMYQCTHGGMGGVPWPKPDDKDWNDLIDEEYYDKRGLPARVARAHPLTGPAQMLLESQTGTRVTYRGDQLNSASVWQRMRANIQSVLARDVAIS